MVIINELYNVLENEKSLFSIINPVLKGGIYCLKKFQLLTGWLYSLRLFPIKQLYLTELFVRNAHDSDLAEVGKERFNSFYMYRRIFTAGTMTDINGELEHCESVTL